MPNGVSIMSPELLKVVSSVPTEQCKHLQSVLSFVWLPGFLPFPTNLQVQIYMLTNGVQTHGMQWAHNGRNAQRGSDRPLRRVAPKCHSVYKEEKQWLPQAPNKEGFVHKKECNDSVLCICLLMITCSPYVLTFHQSKLNDLPLGNQRRA